MKKTLLTMATIGFATAVFGQGYVLFENANTSSGTVNLYTEDGPFAEPGTYTVALLWYNGSSYQQIAVYATGPNGDYEGKFYGPGVAITVPTYSATGTFIVQGWTGNYSNYTAAAAAGGAELIGQTAPFVAFESTNAATAPSVAAIIGRAPYWDGELVLAPLPVPTISNQPVSISTYVGSNVAFGVTAGGPSLSYQWQFNGSSLPTATNSNLSLADVQLTNAGNYDVIVTNIYGSVTSSVAVLSVGPAGAPSVYVNSNLASITASAVGSAAISLVSGFTNGFVFYTLDGSPPTSSSILYQSSFTLTNSAIIKAIGYRSDFNQSATMQPLALAIVPLYTISNSVSGVGSVSFSPNTNLFVSNSAVTLTATAGSNWVFQQWTGDVNSTANPLTLNVDTNLNIEAVFVPSGRFLTLTTPGGGTVMANGEIITGAYYPSNSVVTLTATTNSGWTFMGWQGGITSSSNPYYLNMTEAYHIRGIFGTVLTTNPVGGGQIILSKSNLFDYGDAVTASAVPNNGNYLVLWSGTASGTNNPVTTTVTNPAINALFGTLPVNKLSLSVVVVGGGQVAISPQQSYYNYGDTVTLTATPNYTLYFDGWSGGHSDTNSTTVVTMTTNLVVYANFGSQPIVPPSMGVAIALVPPLVAITITGTVGNDYVIQKTSDFSDPSSWITVTNLVLSVPVQSWVDSNQDVTLPANSREFYRVLPHP